MLDSGSSVEKSVGRDAWKRRSYGHYKRYRHYKEQTLSASQMILYNKNVNLSDCRNDKIK